MTMKKLTASLLALSLIAALPVKAAVVAPVPDKIADSPRERGYLCLW